MIFDSDRYYSLLSKYKGKRKYQLPDILLLEDFGKEKEHLEHLIYYVPEVKREALLSRLITDSYSNHISAWFELRLFGWLRELGKAEFEPVLFARKPDASLVIDGQNVAFEGRVIEEIREVRNENKLYGQLWYLLRKIHRPYRVHLKALTLKYVTDEQHFVQAVSNWLDTRSSEILDYGDDTSGHLVMEAHYSKSLDSLEIMGPTRLNYANVSTIKRPIKKKASQHAEIRGSGTPYVIALLVEPFLLSAEEVVEACLEDGKLLPQFMNLKQKYWMKSLTKRGCITGVGTSCTKG